MSVTVSEDRAENLSVAVIAGLGAALVGAGLWAAVTAATQMKLGIVSVAVGALIGIAIRRAGRAKSPRFQILGALCGVIGWVLGTILSDLAMLAQFSQSDILTTLMGTSLARLQSLVIVAATPMDALFFAITVYEAYRFSVARR